MPSVTQEMATFVNTPNQSSRHATLGERRVYRCLNALLEDDYLCWFDVPIGDRRRYPDFVILHPRRGILILEVKDWAISSIRRIDKLRVELLVDQGIKKVDNPLQQARACALEIKDTLGRDPQLREADGSFRGRLCFPYGFGTVLTGITRQQLDEGISIEDQELVLPPGLVICKDELNDSGDPAAFQERLWGMFPYSFGGALSLPQIDRIRWHLFPEIRIGATQGDLFGAGNAVETATGADAGVTAQSMPEVIRVMDLEQERLARGLGNGHRVIHGVAGSGKTLLLGYRGVHLAQATSRPILALCFNVTLSARLRSFFAERGLSGKVHVRHFHGWCKEQLRTYHVEVLPGDEEVWVRQVKSVIQGVEAGWIPRAQYGAVMIDEGHDFDAEWLRLVVQMVDPETDSLLLLYDDAQSIYRPTSALDFSLSSVGIKAKGRTTILRMNYRNTREILDLAYRFAQAFISPRDADDDHLPILAPESAGGSGPPPSFQVVNSFPDELDYAMQRLSEWNEAGEAPNEIAVVVMRKHQATEVASRLRACGLSFLLMNSTATKSAYDPRNPLISIVTAPSSKGLEFNRVMVMGIGALAEPGQNAASDDTKLLYVAMTRARETLALSACQTNCYTERLRALLGQPPGNVGDSQLGCAKL